MPTLPCPHCHAPLSFTTPLASPGTCPACGGTFATDPQSTAVTCLIPLPPRTRNFPAPPAKPGRFAAPPVGPPVLVWLALVLLAFLTVGLIVAVRSPSGTVSPAPQPPAADPFDFTSTGEPIVVSYNEVRVTLTATLDYPPVTHVRNGLDWKPVTRRALAWHVKPCILVEVLVENVSPTRRVEYDGWGDSFIPPSMIDEHGNRYRHAHHDTVFTLRMRHRDGRATIDPGKRVTDYVCMEPPIDAASQLAILLPLKVFSVCRGADTDKAITVRLKRPWPSPPDLAPPDPPPPAKQGNKAEARPDPDPVPPAPLAGALAALGKAGDKTPVHAALDRDGFADLAADPAGADRLVAAGRAVALEAGTRCRLLRLGAQKAEVRISEGPHQGKEVWVNPSALVAAAAPAEVADPANPLLGAWQQTNNLKGWHFEFRTSTVIQTGLFGPYSYAYTLTGPGRLSWTTRGGGVTFHAIYKVEGDTLTLCHSVKGYPERFEEDLGERSIHLWVFRRVR